MLATPFRLLKLSPAGFWRGQIRHGCVQIIQTFIQLWDYKFQRVEESVLNGTSSFQFNAVSIFRRDELREVP